MSAIAQRKSELSYHGELCDAMGLLAAHPKTIFLGQAVEYPGTAMFGTLGQVPMEKRLELPVAEEMQMGMSIGLAMAGFIPVSIYTRWNFLLLAANQLVNHLDKIPVYSDYRPMVIVRVGVGSRYPMDPGPQHLGDFTCAFASICDNINFEILDAPDQIMFEDRYALNESKKPTVLVEISDLLNE